MLSLSKRSKTMFATGYSNETLGCLRNCSLMDGGEYDSKRFVRCIPTRPGERLLPAQDALAQAARVVKEINEPGVIVSWHETFGDYVRVETNTKTYGLICHMKS
jgi:hypothetical protein